MEAIDYNELTPEQLMALAIWREARGEPMMGKVGVGYVISNRAHNPSWWGSDTKSVILKPWQFSSFNANDPNTNLWPDDVDPSWVDSQSAASVVYNGTMQDPTDGAVNYKVSSIPWPKGWGEKSAYVETTVIGNHTFYRLATTGNHDEVAEAST